MFRKVINSVLFVVACLALCAPVQASTGYPYGSACQGACGIGTNINSVITAVNVTSNVATLTVPNNFVVGGPVNVTGLSNSFLNGSWTVTAATTSQVSYTVSHANLSTVSDNGLVNSFKCVVYDSNSGDAPVACGTAITDYTPANFASTVDVTALNFTWDTAVSSNACVVLGALLNTSDRTQCQVTGPGGTYVVGVHHQVIVRHLVPAASSGSGGTSTTFYITSNSNATTTNPGSNYDIGQSSFPGPQCTADGKNCYLNIYSPNPGANLPIQWDLTLPGVQTAHPGYPSMIPIYLLWKNGNATQAQGTAGLGPCTSAQTNYLGHLYPPSFSAANSGTWYTCNGTAWVPNGSSPIWVASATITQGANTYTCHANSNGGHNPSTRVPTGTCTGGAGDSGIAVIPFYAGIWENTSSGTDYRDIGFTSIGGGSYYFDMNGVAPPLNPQPTAVMEVYPSTTSITGTMAVNLTLTLYTSSGGVPAAGTTPVQASYPITVNPLPLVTQSTPTPTTDTNLPKYYNWNATSSINMCSNAGFSYSMDYWNLTLKAWMWYPISASDFGESQTWNYDNSRTFLGAEDQFLHKMDGSAWSNWAANTTYGDIYVHMAITPASDPNGNTWLATVNGGVSNATTQPTWSAHGTVGNTVTDGTQIWLNVGNKTYWNRCVENSGMPYLNAMSLAPNTLSQFSLFTGALDKNRQRTNDSVTKDNTIVTGLYSHGEQVAIGGVFGGGAFSPFSSNAGRGAAYQLDTWATFWRTSCQQGNCAAFTSNDQYKRMAFYDINSTLNYWDLFAHQPEFSNGDSFADGATKAYGPVIIPFYIGVGMEGIIEWYGVCKELDPTNTTGLCGDVRMIPAIKQITGYMWMNWWDMAFKGGGPHNYSFSYDPRDVQTAAIVEPFYTELVGPEEPAYDFMYAYCGGDPTNCVTPDNTTYDVASDQIRAHQYDSRNCNFWTCQGGGHFFGHQFAGGTGSPKMFGQSNKWGLGNSYNWRYGYNPYFLDDLSPQNNPCWDLSPAQPCPGGTKHPYPDTQQPYPFQILVDGSGGQDDPGAEGNFIYQTVNVTAVSVAAVSCGSNTATATITANNSFFTGKSTTLAGLANTFLNGSHSLSSVSPTSFSFCINHAALGTTPDSGTAVQGKTYSPLINIGSTQVTVDYYLYEQVAPGQTWVNYGTTTSCNTGTSSTENAGFPNNPGFGTEVWEHNIQVTGLLPATLYYVQMCAKDYAGNQACSPCAPISGGFNGGGINFTTLPQTTLVVSGSSLPAGQTFTSYLGTMGAQGGTPPYTWCILETGGGCDNGSGGALPPGLTVSTVSNVGQITGTPTTRGLYSFTAKVTDSASHTATSTGFSININDLKITTNSPLASGSVGVPYNANISTTGGILPFTWSIVSVLPSNPGFTISGTGATGTIDGTPLTSGTFNVSVRVVDSASPQQTVTKTLVITISGGGLSVTTNTCPGGTVNIPYTCGLAAAGGTPPYTWGLNNGTLPAGLTLSGGTGLTGLNYTTDLTTENGNNTSASSLFTNTSDGDEAATNVSKVDVHSLLYTGNTTYTYAHLEPWFCTTNGQGQPCNGHIYVGYNSNDAAQVAKQVNDMRSRGLNGLVIDWYGKPFGTVNGGCPQGASHCIEDQSSQKVVAYTDSLCVGGNCPFTMHLMEDFGSFQSRCVNSPFDGYANAQACVIGILEIDLGWMNTQYWGHVSYLKKSGKPIVGVFAYESEYTGVNWTTVWNTVAAFAATLSNAGGGPLLYFENNGGFTHANSSGAFAWVQINTGNANDIALTYLDSFYTLGKTKTTQTTFGGSWSGFNDSLASWGSGRIMNQNCGDTLIKTTHEAGNFYNTTTQLPFMEFVTWNDYDEGSEMESGVKSCATVASVSLSGSILNWSAGFTGGGTSQVIDHYTVYITSQTGANPQLSVLADNIPVTQNSLDLSTFSSLPNGNYFLYVKMVGKPMLSNDISSGTVGPFTVTTNGCQTGCGNSIVGTPEVNGTNNFTVKVTDSNNVTAVSSQLHITVGYPPIIINNTTLSNGMPLFNYTDQMSAIGGDGNYTWNVLSGTVPDGLTFNPDGSVGGIPLTPGTFNMTVQVADNSGDVTTGPLQIIVESPINITAPLSMPNGTVGVVYNVTVVTAGGVLPITCSITSAPVPGVDFTPGTCVYTGTPTVGGVYPITVRATDTNGFYNLPDQPYTVTVSGSFTSRVSIEGKVKHEGTVRVR